jgi:hypothetical protein
MWFVGVVTKIDKRRSHKVVADFADGLSHLLCDPAMYGVRQGRQWALLQPATRPASRKRRATSIDVDEESEEEEEATGLEPHASQNATTAMQ